MTLARALLKQEWESLANTDFHRFSILLSWLKLPLFHRLQRDSVKYRVGSLIDDRVMNFAFLIYDVLHNHGAGDALSPRTQRVMWLNRFDQLGNDR